MPPRVLGHRYRLDAPLGRGGAATTWRARDLARDVEVALKLLDLPGRAAAEAFRHEFARLTGLVHESLVEALDFGVERDAQGELRPFATFGLVRGQTLGAFAAAAPAEAWLGPLTDAVAALGYLHQAGLRHGDFKPDNVVVDASGRGVLLDLGAAAPLGARAGAVVSGTPRYLAPEIASERPLDARADLYAVGVTLRTIAERSGRPLPPELEALAIRLVATDPDARPADTAELLVALGRPRPTARFFAVEAPRLLGRAEAMNAAQRGLAALFAGEPGPRILRVEGPAGTGRSRLLREIEWAAQLSGDTVRGDPAAPDAVASLLARAAKLEELAPGIDAAIRAHEVLAARARPVVLVLDDAGALPDAQRALLEAFSRLLGPDDAVLLATVGPELPSSRGVSARLVTEPLERGDVAEWLPALSDSELDEAMRRTAGNARAVRELAGLLASGGDVVDGREEPHGLPVARREALGSLAPELRDVVLLLAAHEGPLDDGALRVLGGERLEPWRAAAEGWLAREGGRWRLARGDERVALLEAGPAEVVRRWRDRLVEWLRADAAGGDTPSEAPPDASDREARITGHLAASARLEEACRVAAGARDRWGSAPRAWRRAAEELARAAPQDDLASRRVAAELLEVCGRPDRALELLAFAPPEGELDPASRVALALARASCHSKRGDHVAVLATLSELPASVAPELVARAADLRSRARLRQGDYAGAAAEARAALEAGDVPGAVRGELLEDLGLARSYLGEHAAAAEALDAAVVAHEQRGDARRLARALVCAAIDAYRAGGVDDAIARYRRALGLAEAHALVDLVASTSLNLGSALHQQGEWGAALEAYARGGRLAAALGQSDVALTPVFDEAKLHADLGSYADAERALRAARALAERDASPFFRAACDDLDGEIRLLRDGAGAIAAFRAAERGFEALGASRELVEVRLHLAEAATPHDGREARRWLELAEAEIARLRAADLALRAAVVRAGIELAAGSGERAREVLQTAAHQEGAEAASLLGAELDARFAEAWERDGASWLAAEHRQRARKRWERTAAGLPASLRAVFWQHPRRRGLELVAPSPGGGSGGPSRRETKLEKLVAVNRLLASTLETEEVLRRTMDAAIELAGAERGFLILARAGAPDALEVAVARNVDRERIGRSHLKFSRSIAERVVETGQPIVAADASTDDRFASEESVHAMRLRSVAAVPIRAGDDVLGALYLDNRFQPARFDVADLDLLTSFADQVAIALRNAAMHEALARRTRELERERQKVELVMRGQAERIEELTAEVRTQREAFQRRYAYEGMVAGSPAMQRVLATLDRVIDSTLSVLVMGESGTGKELVARAVHAHSSRSAGPFVGINCAALPESLLEAELFGHARGAFTGADRDRPGLMVAARGGTLFLDEIGELPLAMQAKLLRALQEREVRPVGSAATVAVDFRLVCATNRVLRDEVAEGRFREDLFYRVGVVEVRLPPLRERPDDVPELARRALERLARELGRPAPALSPRAMQALLRAPWPGNVRQLENVLARAAITAEGAVIEEGDLELDAADRAADRRRRRATTREEIEDALRRSGGHAGEAARKVGVSRATFYRRLAALGIDRG